MDKSIKNAITAGIIIISIGIIVMSGYFFTETSGYWKSYFQMKQNKIELSTEQAVDSLINVINTNIKDYTLMENSLTVEIEKLKNDVALKNNIIENQNKEIKNYKSVLSNISE
jgi:hypothetical protein